MKRLIILTIFMVIRLSTFSQNIELNSNGYKLKFTKKDSLVYYEFSMASINNSKLMKNDFYDIKMKYSFGTISKSYKRDNLENLDYSSSFYLYEDGTLQAPSKNLFFKPRNINDFQKKYKGIGVIEKHSTLEGYYYLYVTD